MTLPKIQQPLFTMVQPSTGKEVTYRPFLVAEEKILLIAQQSDSDKDITLAIKQILNNVIQNTDFDPKNLTTFDLEIMFLKLRAKSVNNVVEVSFIDREDNKQYDFSINLDEIEIIFDPDNNPRIAINENVGIIMRYPTIDMLAELPDDIDYLEIVDQLVIKCISKVYTEDTVYAAEEYTPEEMKEFIDSLDVNTYDKIRNFFITLPKISHKLKYKNSLDHDREVELKTLKDFFMWG